MVKGDKITQLSIANLSNIVVRKETNEEGIQLDVVYIFDYEFNKHVHVLKFEKKKLIGENTIVEDEPQSKISNNIYFQGDFEPYQLAKLNEGSAQALVSIVKRSLQPKEIKNFDINYTEFSTEISEIPSENPNKPTEISDSYKSLRGYNHDFVLLETRNYLLTGFFKKNENCKYQFQNSALLVNNLIDNSKTSTIKVPGCLVNTVKHTSIQTKSYVFYIGGLIPKDMSKEYSIDENMLENSDPLKDYLKSGENFRVSNVIICYDTINYSSKIVGYLREPVYDPRVFLYKKRLFICGGKTVDNKLTKTVSVFDLTTFEFMDYHIDIALKYEDHHILEAFQLDNLIYIGFQGINEVYVIN